MIRVGINGFGRIGRQVFRAILERCPETVRVVAVNDLFDVATNAHLLSFDTNYGRFPGTVRVRKDGFSVNGRPVRNFALRDPARIPWDDAFTRIAKLLKQDRDANFVAKTADGKTVNRWTTTGFLGASASSNEAGYITHKVIRSLGALAFDNQARV